MKKIKAVPARRTLKLIDLTDWYLPAIHEDLLGRYKKAFDKLAELMMDGLSAELLEQVCMKGAAQALRAACEHGGFIDFSALKSATCAPLQITLDLELGEECTPSVEMRFDLAHAVEALAEQIESGDWESPEADRKNLKHLHRIALALHAAATRVNNAYAERIERGGPK